jgi:hypothetical protein
MPIFMVYQAENGAPVSSTVDPAQIAPAEILAARGYAVAERPDEEAGGIWNPAELRFDPRPAEPPPPREVTAYAFTLRLRPDEVIAIETSTDPTVIYFRKLLDIAAASGVMVDLDSARVAGGLSAAVAARCITTDRVPEILA